MALPRKDISEEEREKIASRPLYRPGQAPAAKPAEDKNKKESRGWFGLGGSKKESEKKKPTPAKPAPFQLPPSLQSPLPVPKQPTPPPPTKTEAKEKKKKPRAEGPRNIKKRVLQTLAVLLWMLLLGAGSYCIFLPDPDQIAKEVIAIRNDPNLKWEEKGEKIKALGAKLDPGQQKEVRASLEKDGARKANERMHDFLAMSKDEQVAKVKEDLDRMERFRQQWANRNNNKGNGNANGGGRGGGGGGGGGGRGGGGGGFGGGGGGGGGGGAGRGSDDARQRERSRLDNLSPETRAGLNFRNGLMNSLRGGGTRGGR